MLENWRTWMGLAMLYMYDVDDMWQKEKGREKKRPLDLTSVSMNYSFTRYFIHSFMHAPWQLQSSQVVKMSLSLRLPLHLRLRLRRGEALL